MRTTPGTNRMNDRQSEVLAVAASHLNTMGVSVEWFTEIATSLGLTRPALYKYVVDREDLLFRCYELSCDALDARLSAAQATNADVIDVLSAFLAVPEAGGGEAAVISEVLALAPEQQKVIWSRQRALSGRLTCLVADGVTAGVFRSVNCEVVANAIVGMASWSPLYSRWGVGIDPDLVAQGSRELLFRGVASNPGVRCLQTDRLVTLAAPRPDIFDKAAVDAAKREGVLVAASALFNSRGIGATRIEDVGAMIGLSKRSVYHYVGQKQVLVDACVERAFAYFLAVIDAAEGLESDALDSLYACVRDVVWAACDPSVSVLVPYVGFGQLSLAEREAVAGHTRRLSDGYSRLLQRGFADGSIRPLPVDAILASLPGVFSWAVGAPSDGTDDYNDIAEALADLVTRGICA